MDQMTKKEIVLKYSMQINELMKEARKWLTENDEKPDEAEILEHVENAFFDCREVANVEISSIRTIIDSVCRRVSSKYGILTELLNDDDVNEIMVNGPNAIFAEKNRQLISIDDAFISEDELEELIRMFASDVHREINEANPIVDARLQSGYRVNGVLKNVALNGPILTIRKFADQDIEIEDLIEYGSLSRECAYDLQSLVNSGYNIFISGGTSSGKTTFLNALAASVGRYERAIIIEDSAELRIGHLSNKVHMECRSANSIGKGAVTMAQLIRTSLRMRPDRIIVGEVRGREVVDMIQAMNTGHEGSMSTGHGNSIKGMLNRLETMYLMDAQVPMHSIKSQIANAIDVFVHLRRDSCGERKLVEVAELCGFDGTDYLINYLYETGSDGSLRRTGNALKDRERLVRAGFGDVLTEANDD